MKAKAKYVFILAAVFAVALAFAGCKDGPIPDTDKGEVTGQVFITVEYTELAQGGYYLDLYEIEMYQNDSVFDVTYRALKKEGINLIYSGSVKRKTVYIEQIGDINLHKGIGWTYYLNGVFPERGSSAVAVAPGDIIEWRFAAKAKA